MAYQQGGWYNGQQYWGGQLGPKGVIINPGQTGYGRPVGQSVPTGAGPGPSPITTPAPVYVPPPPPPISPIESKKRIEEKSANLPFTLDGSPVSAPSAGLKVQGVSPNPPAVPKGPIEQIANNPNIPKGTIPDPPKMNPKQATQEISTATNDAIHSGADPAVLNEARKYLGARDYIGFCQSFVEQVTGSGWRGGSAYDAWNRQRNQSVLGLQGIKPGDAVYFAPDKSNDGFGHTGVYAGNGQFISATNSGVKQFDLGAWVRSTGQKILGYIPMVGRALGISQPSGIAQTPTFTSGGSSPTIPGGNLQAKFSPQMMQALILAMQRAKGGQSVPMAQAPVSPVVNPLERKKKRLYV